MDNATIKLYKDGDDLIVVFKNASDDIASLITRMLQPDAPQPEIVPDLVPQPEYAEEAPPNLAAAECLTQDKPLPEEPAEVCRIQTFDEFRSGLADLIKLDLDSEAYVQTKEACRKYFESHDRVRADKISTLALPRVKSFVKFFYWLDSDTINAFLESKRSTFEEFADSVPEDKLRNTAEAIGKTIVSFFETVV